MLAEIREDEARGAVAATYADIRGTLGVPLVNYIWRHLATIDGALDWCWPRVREAAPAIRGAVPSAHALVDDLLHRNGVALPPAAPWPPQARDVLLSYNRGNSWNMLALALLAAARADATPNWPARSTPASEDSLQVPPYPRLEDVPQAAMAAVQRLSTAGPAAGSGVRPSLWVHLGLWPDLLHAVARQAVPLLRSDAFSGAWSGLRAGSGALLGLQPASPGAAAQPSTNPLDNAIGRFQSRIAEMVLIGRAMSLAQPSAQSPGF